MIDNTTHHEGDHTMNITEIIKLEIPDLARVLSQIKDPAILTAIAEAAEAAYDDHLARGASRIDGTSRGSRQLLEASHFAFNARRRLEW